MQKGYNRKRKAETAIAADHMRTLKAAILNAPHYTHKKYLEPTDVLTLPGDEKHRFSLNKVTAGQVWQMINNSNKKQLN